MLIGLATMSRVELGNQQKIYIILLKPLQSTIADILCALHPPMFQRNQHVVVAKDPLRS